MENGHIVPLSVHSRTRNRKDLFFKEFVTINLQEAKNLQSRTTGQRKSAEWFRERENRLTASNFAKVFARKAAPNRNLMYDIFQPCDCSNKAAIEHGNHYEKVAKGLYARKMHTHTPGFKVTNTGLSINPQWPYLGATPDGLVYDPSIHSHHGLLEIKCPLSKSTSTLDQAAMDPNFYLEKRYNKFFLKKDSAYYCQIQGQMAITGIHWCHFCVYLADSNEMSVTNVIFDKDFWYQKLLPKLTDFYINHALDFLVYELQR